MKLSPSCLKNAKSFLLDLIFPRNCLGCRKTDTYICEVCFNKITINRDVLPWRGSKNSALSGIFAASRYTDPILREMIHAFKYHSIESLKKPLSQIAINYLIRNDLKTKFNNAILVPIPLTQRRQISRGFNQSELLTIEISKYLNLPVMNLLKRKKFSAPQAEINDWQKRKENISGAFKLSPSYPQHYRHRMSIVLVDDVATSGATLEEAARVLKEAGFEKIYGLVIAKG